LADFLIGARRIKPGYHAVPARQCSKRRFGWVPRRGRRGPRAARFVLLARGMNPGVLPFYFERNVIYIGMVDTVLEDRLGPGGYDPGLYPSGKRWDLVKGFENVSDAMIARFHRDGFLAIEGAFFQSQVDAGLSAISDLIDGEIPDFRGVQFEKGLRKAVAEKTGQERQSGVRKLNRFIGYDKRLDQFAESAGLLNTLGRIFEKPPTLFRDQAMLKPARVGREKPWHQDLAYFDLPLETCVVSVWIALDEATPENGCMHVIPGSHREGPVVHFRRRDWQICDAHVAPDRAVSVALPPGGILLWHGMLHHGTPANRSDESRRALQLHFIPEGVDETPQGDRLAIFGSEGKDVTC